MNKTYHMHFIGIGGYGMSGISAVFAKRGHIVSGSDQQHSETLDQLKSIGVHVHVGHNADHVKLPCDVVITSTAIRADNVEVIKAKQLGIPIVPRAEMLAELMRGKNGIAVAGTHGKTTTTTMIGQVFHEAGFDPTVVVGGKVEAFGGNSTSGKSDWVIAEADESDGSFQFLPFIHAVITNLDEDHMDFFESREKVHQAFVDFHRKTPFFGSTWICGDDPGLLEVKDRFIKPYKTYGFSAENNLQATNLQAIPAQNKMQFQVTERYGNQTIDHGTFELGVLGEHNVLNALACIGIASDANIPLDSVRKSLASFKHARRRFDVRYKDNALTLVDDYGHHPTEIEAVLNTARMLQPNRIRAVFQPHRYTRTKHSWKGFVHCFKNCDELILLPIYPAGESPIHGIDHVNLAAEITKNYPNIQAKTAESFDQAESMLFPTQTGDLILTLGAGSVTKFAEQVCKKITR